MIGNILTPAHMLLVLVVALVVLGPKRLPEAGRGLGSALRGFKDALSMPEDRDQQRMVGSAPEHQEAADTSAPDNSARSERQESSAALD
jgi:sec-independent protein translocase protein TatA